MTNNTRDLLCEMYGDGVVAPAPGQAAGELSLPTPATLAPWPAAVVGGVLPSDHPTSNELPRALTEDEQRLRVLSDALEDYAIFRLDTEGTVLSWDAAAERIKGYRADEIIGRNYSRFFNQADIDLGMPRYCLERAAATGRSEFEHWRVRKDGSESWAIVVITAVRGHSGALLGYYEISRHITAREQDADRHLAQSESRYHSLLEAAPDAMVVVNQTGAIVLLNLQAESQFGYSRDELVGQQVTNIIPDGFAERLIADGTRSAAEAIAQQIGTGLELTGRRKNGTEFPIEIMLSPVASDGGVLVTAAVRNITARKRAEEVLLTTVNALKRSNDELAQFAHVASHDLQEPLRMIASYTQLLAKRYKGRLDSDADEFIEYAVDGASRMQRLIQDLLAYSRAGETDATLHLLPTAVALQDAVANLQATIAESGAVVSSDSLPSLKTDHTLLTQVFQNLLGNAIKYRGADAPRVHVSAVRAGAEWTFAVQDNGLGIEPQYFERIFVIFQRLHARSEFQGTGIGLAICKKMVTRLGGRIWVDSQVGKGSTFRFTVPSGAEQ